MRRYLNLTPLLFLLFFSTTSTASVWRSKECVKINGLVYDAILSYVPNIGANRDSLAITLQFYLACAEPGNYSKFEELGTSYNIRKFYVGQPNNNASQSSQYSTRLTTRYNDGLILNRYTWCFPTYYNNEIQVLLFTGNDNENIKIDFRSTNSTLFKPDFTEVFPVDYRDVTKIESYREQQKKYNKSESEIIEYFKKFSIYKNFEPTLSNNIENLDFPNNQTLKQLLQNNTEFNFRLSKDFYLEILRFRMISYDYTIDKIKTILKDYDQNYSQYSSNEFSITKKIEACVNILREAIKKINWGDIFYKDFEITLGKYDFQNKLFTLLQRDFRDDYFSTKKLMGETSIFYSSKGVHIYWANWGSMSDLVIPESEAENFLAKVGSNSRRIKYRIYFLLQPISCFDESANFQGITAYGLKGVLYRNCISDELRTIDNNFINQIADKDISRCYRDATTYLNTQNTSSNNKYTIDKSAYINYGATNIAYWSQNHSENCETGYFMLNGKIEKENQEQRLITFYVQTNYYYVMQPGYEIKFSNTNSGANYPLVVKDIIQIGNEPNASILQLTVKITKKTIIEMINAKINDIQIQISGAPKYQWTGSPVYNWDETIKSRINILGAHYNSSPESITNFLKKGL